MTGLCECGCGKPAPIAPQSHTKRGWVLGQPLRFIRGHSAKRVVVTKSYRKAPGATAKRLHVVRAERALGKTLPLGAVVHHADGSKRDDAPLVICQDQRYHALLHLRMRIKAAGGDPDTDAICGRCRTVKPRTAFGKDPSNVLHGIYRWCSVCAAAGQRARLRKRRIAEAAA